MTNCDSQSASCINPMAEILEALMIKHRLNQTDLAHRSGVSQPGINRILNERSKAKQPRKETLEKIATVLGVRRINWPAGRLFPHAYLPGAWFRY